MKQPMPPMQQPMMQLPPNLQKIIDDPEYLAELMQNPTWEEVEELLRDDAMLGFRIDIETDSTIKADEEGEKAARVELLTAVSQFIANAAEIQDPAIKVFMAELLGFGVRGFRTGKNIEGAVELLIKAAEQQAKNPPPAQPNPEMMKVQIQQQKNEAELQLKQQQAQIDNQNNQQKAAAQAADDQREAQTQAANDQREAELQQHRAMLEMQFEREKFAMQLAHDEKIELLKIQAQKEMHQYGVDNAPKPEKKDGVS